MWVDITGIPITTSIPKDIRRRRQEKYLSDRDGYRAKRGAPPVWAGTRGAFAAVQYELTKVHRGELARRVGVIWDNGAGSASFPVVECRRPALEQEGPHANYLGVVGKTKKAPTRRWRERGFTL